MSDKMTSDRSVFGPPASYKIFEDKWFQKLDALNRKHAGSFADPTTLPELYAFFRNSINREVDALAHIICYDREAKGLGFTTQVLEQVQSMRAFKNSVAYLAETERKMLLDFAHGWQNRKMGVLGFCFRCQQIPLKLRRQVNDLIWKIMEQERTEGWVENQTVHKEVRAVAVQIYGPD